MANLGAALAMVVFVPGTLVTTRDADLHAEFAYLLSEIGVMGQEMDSHAADACGVTTQLDAVSKIGNVIACQGNGRALFCFELCLKALIDALTDRKVPIHTSPSTHQRRRSMEGARQ